MKVIRASQLTAKVSEMEIDVTQAQLDRWENGELIQVAMPNLTADEREFIMTGITPEDWNHMWERTE